MDSHSTGCNEPRTEGSVSSDLGISPFDFGDSREEILRALELNRQLLYDANVILKLDEGIDKAAVCGKIDELLDRLVAREFVDIAHGT